MPGKRRRNNAVLTPSDIKNEERREKAAVILKESGSTKKMTGLQKNLAVEMLSNPQKPFRAQAEAAGYKVSPGSNMSGLKRQISGKLANTLEEAGIFECDLGRAFAEGLMAQKTIIVKSTVRDENTGKIIGENIEPLQVPDHGIRAIYLKLALQVGNYFPATKVEHSGKIDHDHKLTKLQRLVEEIPVEVLDREIRLLEENAVDAKVEIIEEGESCQSAA